MWLYVVDLWFARKQCMLHEMGSKSTLVIRHLPPDLSSAERVELLKYFGAIEIKNLTSKFKKSNTVFAKFESENAATTALHQLHQLNVLGHYLTVEYARGSSDKFITSDVENKLHSKKQEGEEENENFSKYYHTFISKLNNWSSSLNITQPPPSHLKYQYPPPSQLVLRNICCALASAPKFYTQVLHLMNKLNLPCPFQSEPFPDADVILPPEPVKNVENIVSEEEEEEESELESDSEGYQLTGEIVPIKRTLPHKPRKVKRPKFIKPTPTLSVPSAKSLKPEEVFEKITCEPVQRKIELKLVGVPESDKVGKESMEASGSFGLLFPVAKDENTEEESINENTEAKEDATLKHSTISSEELASNRISSRDQKHLPVFRNYQPGIPSCRLYIKNLSKQVTERDLHYIYRRYCLQKEEQDNMFNIQLMTEGRMKGQAFITLHSVKQAEVALKETNGFILKDKPLVVQFARSAKAK